MIINSQSLELLRVGFKTLFQEGLGMTAPMWEKIATRVPSTAGTEKYGFLGELPGMRVWEGSRALHALRESDYSLKNLPYENTVAVDRDAIADDALGQNAPRFKQLGKTTRAQYDILSWALLKAGFATNCYDGQFFFDTDHPVLDAAGAVQPVANTDGGAGTAWFLIDSSQVMLPIILQVRKEWEFAAMDRATDPNVFMNKKFLYGVDGRCAAGYGFWQFAWGSKQALTAANYAIARAALSSMKADYGRPLGVMPNLLIVPPGLEQAGRDLVISATGAAGATNPWKGSAELAVVPWLA